MVNSNSTPSGRTVVKAGLWYTISNFLLRSLGFLTVPIFSRVMSASDYGSYSTFTACLSIMIVLTGFDAYSSIIRSKYEVKEDLDSYILSVLAVNTVFTIFFYGTFLVFPGFYCDIFQVNEACIHYMFVYLLLIPAFNLISTKQRAFYRYKTFVVLTAVITIGSVALSIAFVFLFKDSLTARILGQYAPGIVVGLILYIYIIVKGKHIKWKYCSYVMVLCLPLLPHLLSIYALSTSNRILITLFCGSDKTAIYAIASSATHIVSALFDSANKAWAPWLLDSLHSGERENIWRFSNFYYLVLVFIAICTLLVGPEVIFILGGEGLYDSRFLLPPLILGCIFQIIYTMYVNVEFYLKKTKITAAATFISALFSVGASVLFINYFGYSAAAWATALGYGVLLLAHYICILKFGYEDVFDRKILFGSLIPLSIFCCCCEFIYQFLWIRLFLLIVTVITFGVFIKKNYGHIASLKVKGRKNE